MSEPILLAWSGGKDSSLALAALRRDPMVYVVGLLTTVTPAYDRVSIHGVRRTILHAQAQALGLPLFEAELHTTSSNTDYEAAWARALADARAALGPVESLAFGDLYLADVRAFRESLGAQLGYRSHFPLWGSDTRALAAHFIAEGYEAYLSCVDTTQLDAAFAGRRFDETLLAALPDTVDPCGENGEFHTCVVGGPIFAAQIPITVGERVRRDERFEYCDLIPEGESP
ncbi:MAG: hypothetical protein K2X99_10725 [Gemmatimonadaceae bacterium]|nr:hypothetical protein [Gemmatimonadaceae bacterium]